MTKNSTPSKMKEKFNLKDIKELISILRRNHVWEFNLEQNGIKIHIVTGKSEKAKKQKGDKEERSMHHVPTAYSPMVSMAPAAPPVTPYPASPTETPAPETNSTEKAAEEQKEEERKNLISVKSPMVGTFYRAPAPDSPPYVEEGDPVKDDTVLCIIEAMKLMNELKAECSGKVVDILVENGQPVEYGQQLFLIDQS